MMKAALRRVVIATVFATSINAGYGETWWMPDKNRFHHVDSAETTANNSTWVYATTKHDLDRMLSVVDLFPPYMFDSKTQYLAGGSIGPHTNYGYIIMVDGGQVTFVVTEDRATDLAGSRIMTYLLIRDLASSCPVIPVSGEASKEETLWGMYRAGGDQGSGRDKRGFDTPGMHFHSQ